MSVSDLIKKTVEKYQCPGCVNGYNISCYEKSYSHSCKKHVAGTMGTPHIGRFFLGMPKGFDRLGPIDNIQIDIFKKISECLHYDKFNIPVWKRLDENGNTLVRGISPRINKPFLHIIIGNNLLEIDCIEITDEDIKNMD